MKHDLTTVEISTLDGKVLFGDIFQDDEDNTYQVIERLKEFIFTYDREKNNNAPLELVIEHYKKI
jgi:hypothetical protein